MSFRRNAPATLIAAAAIVIVALTWISHTLFSGLTDQVEQGQFDLMRSIVTSQLDAAASKALARADMIASLDATRDAMAAKDRAKLLALYSEMFTRQRDRFGVSQAQFHV